MLPPRDLRDEKTTTMRQCHSENRGRIFASHDNNNMTIRNLPSCLSSCLSFLTLCSLALATNIPFNSISCNTYCNITTNEHEEIQYTQQQQQQQQHYQQQARALFVVSTRHVLRRRTNQNTRRLPKDISRSRSNISGCIAANDQSTESIERCTQWRVGYAHCDGTSQTWITRIANQISWKEAALVCVDCVAGIDGFSIVSEARSLSRKFLLYLVRQKEEKKNE